MPDTLFPRFVLYRLRLRLELGVRRQRLPAYLGSTVRGLFAASFRHLVCVTQAPVCDGCLLLHRCPYPYIFETPPPPHLPDVLQKRFRQAPRPYIFEVPMIYAGEETLELGLVLVGRALDFLPYFLYVVQETGKRGLGRAQVPYRLLAVTDGSQADGPVIFHAEEGIIHDSVPAITLAGLQQQGDAQVRQVTMEFLAPLRIKKYGAYQEAGERIEFATLLDLLLGRLEALALFHCEESWSSNTSCGKRLTACRSWPRICPCNPWSATPTGITRSCPCTASSALSALPGTWPRFCPCCGWASMCISALARLLGWVSIDSILNLYMPRLVSRSAPFQK